jgi:hypothetical protein
MLRSGNVAIECFFRPRKTFTWKNEAGAKEERNQKSVNADATLLIMQDKKKRRA